MYLREMRKMSVVNQNYAKLKESYLFYGISQKVKKYCELHPDKHIYRLGIGDVSLPLCDAVIFAMHDAVDEQASQNTFHGYLPECGTPFLRRTIAEHYKKYSVILDEDEAFVSSGASDELGDIIDLFSRELPAMIAQPVYPAYVDANIMAGRKIIYIDCDEEHGFIPEVPPYEETALIYLCSPNNPTGAVMTRKQLKDWVDYANSTGSVILFDAAYEAFIEDEEYPHSVFEIPGAETCAIEICSLSKTAGFTGTRLGYTIIRKALVRDGMSVHDMWVRNRTAKTNGVSYIIQKGGEAVFTEEGQKQIQENIRYYKENAQILLKALSSAGIHCTGGKNSPYIWMECPQGMDSWQLFDLLLNEIQVVGTPGEGFGGSGARYFRFSAFGDRKETETAAQRLADLLGSDK